MEQKSFLVRCGLGDTFTQVNDQGREAINSEVDFLMVRHFAESAESKEKVQGSVWKA